MDQALHLGLEAGVDDVARAGDVDRLHGGLVAGDDRDARREMEDALAAGKGARQRSGVEEIAVDEFDGDAVEPAAVAAVHERAHVMAAVDEGAYEIGADVAGGAGDRDVHGNDTTAEISQGDQEIRSQT